MMRRSTVLLGGGAVPWHDWQLKEPLLNNYEGWRVLDNVKVSKWQAVVTDMGGQGRHLDPIIDDPRLTHRQRVCRLYRWALKEMAAALVWTQGAKWNLAYKTVRMRFERYRYVTDPAQCDMMVRETQKYLRETCVTPFPMHMDFRWKNTPLCGHLNTLFPGHPQVYDHWTPTEVFIYDDLKMHRYARHNPTTTAPREGWERFGDPSTYNGFSKAFYRPIMAASIICYGIMFHLENYAFLWDDTIDPPDNFHLRNDRFADISMRASFENAERAHHHKGMLQWNDYDWDLVMGRVGQRANEGNFQAMQRFRLDKSETEPALY